jgi:hypothetical protein
VLAAGASAQVPNGNFETGSFPPAWTIGTSGTGSSVTIDAGYGSNASKVAHLSASETYEWNGSDWVGDLKQASLNQLGLSGSEILLSAGQTQLEFEGLSLITGEDLNTPFLTVSYLGGPIDSVAISSTDWQTYTVDLVDGFGDPLPAGTKILLGLNVDIRPPFPDGNEVGEEQYQAIDTYVDNFNLVPLPGTSLLILAGAAAILRRRRR